MKTSISCTSVSRKHDAHRLLIRLSAIVTMTASCGSLAVAQTVDYSRGFRTNDSSLTLIDASVVGGSPTGGGFLRLTPVNQQYTRGGAFTSDRFDVRAFHAEFRIAIQGAADGMTFTLRKNLERSPEAPSLLGAKGSGLGYGVDPFGDYFEKDERIPTSVAVKFDVFNWRNWDAEESSTGVYVNGQAPLSPPDASAINLLPFGIHLRSGRVFHVEMVYDGSVLTLNITDTTTGAKSSHLVPVNIPFYVQGGVAHVGFTAATGELSAVARVFTFQFRPATAETARSLVRESVSVKGVANSLVNILDRAEMAFARKDNPAGSNMMKAFRNEVEAQTGKSILPDKATLLVSISRGVEAARD